MTEKAILATLTGEHFQPVRLHYRVFNRKGLLRAFKKLRCVDHDPPRQRWVWLYDYEARSLPFKQSYAEIPRHHRPIVIGSFFLRGEDKLLLDLRSCERAILAISFFDRYIPRSVAKATEAEVVNKLFSAEDAKLMPDQLFDPQESTVRDPEAEVREAAELAAHIQDPQERLQIASGHLVSRAKQPLPKIERFPVHYYEEGIQGFEALLRVRQIVALQHWLGNPEYSLFDVLQSMQGSR